MTKPLRLLTLFAGAGGADVGLEAAGLKHVLGVEFDEFAAASSRAAGFPVVTGDVRDADLYSEGMADVVWSSFPCQAWSTAGSRKGARDDRNGWPWTTDVLDTVQPTWFLGENVRGLLMHKGSVKHDKEGRASPDDCPRCYFDLRILPDLRERFAWVDFRVLDAADYGVPQRRRRVILAAGPRPLQWPEATHSGEALAKAKWVTGEYWEDVGGNVGSDVGELTRSSTGRLRVEYPIKGEGAGRGPSDEVKRHEVDVEDQPAVTVRVSRPAYYAPVSMAEPSAQEARWLASRKQAGLFAAEPTRFSLLPWTTVRQALGIGGVLEQSRNTENNPRQERPRTTDEPCQAVGTVGNQYLSGEGVRVLGGGHNPNSSDDGVRNLRDLTDEPCTTIAAQNGGGAGNAGPFVVGFQERNSGVRGFQDRSLDDPSPAVLAGSHRDNGLRLVEGRAASEPHRLDSPAPTVTTTEVKGTRGDSMSRRLPSGGKSGGVDRASDALWLATGRRRLDVEECARLQGFPEDYPFQGTKTARYKQVGNAVPPRLAEVLGAAVVLADKVR
jgi:site-specific DNA-cytosine methylase